MDNRVDRSVTISSGNNTNVIVNTGDGDTTQTNTYTASNNDNLEKLVNQLIDHINKLSPADEVEDAVDNANKIKKAIESGDQSRAKKIFEWLPSAVKTSSAVVDLIGKITDMIPN